MAKNKNNLATFFLKSLGLKTYRKSQIDLTERLLLAATIPASAYFDQRLSTQEINCLLLAAKGLTIAETAELLNIQKTTVVTHRDNILRKLSCKSIAQAVFEAIRFGYLRYENIRESS